jgi:hypothetical protein
MSFSNQGWIFSCGFCPITMDKQLIEANKKQSKFFIKTSCFNSFD